MEFQQRLQFLAHVSVEGVRFDFGEEWVLVLPDTDLPLFHVHAEGVSPDAANALAAKHAEMIRRVVYPDAKIVYDTSRPDGTPRKLLDVARLRSLGWRHAIALNDGIKQTYGWFLANYASARGVAAV